MLLRLKWLKIKTFGYNKYAAEHELFASFKFSKLETLVLINILQNKVNARWKHFAFLGIHHLHVDTFKK